MNPSRRNIVTLIAMAMAVATGAAFGQSPCGPLAILPSPNPGSVSNALGGVAAVGDGTAWAIGSTNDGSGGAALILNFDGSQWNNVPVPSEAGGIAMATTGSVPGGDVWMVGTRPHSVYSVEVVCMRARGGSIDRVDSFLNNGGPIGISATGPNDVWTVSGGLWAVDQGGYVQHFDGSAWSTMQLPALFSYRNDPQGIYAAAPDDVWVIGTGGVSREWWVGYIQHWDGSSWEGVPTPFDGQDLVFFESIDGSSADDIWVAGHVNYSEDILMHWDGSTWTRHAGPAASDPLAHVAVAAADHSWAAPYSLAPGSPFFSWDGSAWTDAGVPDVPGAATVNWRDLSRTSGCDVWAVGSYHDGAVHRTLVARLDAGGTQTSGVGDSGPRPVVLLGNQPNPFNPSTVIAFELDVPRQAEVSVYGLDGRLLRTLASGMLDAGLHRVTWDGRDAAGRPVGSGTYLYMVRHDGGTVSGKMALAK